MKSAHLTEEEFSGLAVNETGDRSLSRAESHVRACPACRAELAQLEGAVALFAGQVRGWTATRPLPLNLGQQARRHAWRVTWRPRLATAAVLLITVAGGTASYQHQQTRARLAAERAAADAALFDQINNEVSQQVPESMEPLAQLVSDGTDQDAGSKKSNAGGEDQ